MVRVYAVLAVAGLVLPFSQFLPWLVTYGLDLPRFSAALFVNPISRFFAMDVFVGAVVTIVLVLAEGRRLSRLQRILPVAGTLLVGVSFGLPLFLCLRARKATAPVGGGQA